MSRVHLLTLREPLVFTFKVELRFMREKDGALNFIYFTRAAEHEVPILRGSWALGFAPCLKSSEDGGFGLFTSL